MKAFPADASQRLTQSLQHTFRAVAHPLNYPSFELDVIGSPSITFDEGWSPHIQANLTCAVPEDQDRLDSLDARLGVRVQIFTGYRYGHEDEAEELLADLHLRSRSVSRPENTMSLFLNSDEALMQDFVMIGGETIRTSGIVDLVEDAVKYTSAALFSTTLNSDFDEGEFAEMLQGTDEADPVFGTVITIRPELGSTAWSLVEDAANRCNVWIYCPNGVDWRITRRPEIASEAHHLMAVGESGTALSSEVGLGREQFYNGVLLDYFYYNPGTLKWTAGRLGTAFVTGGTFSIGQIGQKTFYKKMDIPATQRQADAAAKGMLARLLTKGHQYTVTGVALYTLRPGHTVELQLVTGSPVKLLVKAVTFDPANGLMTVQLRKPEHSTIESALEQTS